MDSGIYKIENTVNGKVYVGSTTKPLKRRKYQHFILLKSNKHYNTHLQRSWNKYGEENFKFEEVVKVQENYLIKAEQYWIDYYKSYKDDLGYNDIRYANRVKHTDKIKNKISRRTSEEMPDMSGENHPRYKDKVKLTCEYCNNEYEVIPSRSDSTYCSQSCNAKDRLPNYNKKEKVRLYCNHCGEEYKVIPSRKGRSKYCSQSCKGKDEDNAPTLKGEDNPFYGKDHSEEVKDKIREANEGRELSDETIDKMLDSRESLKGSNHPTSKLDETDVKIIKYLLKSGNYTQKKISNIFNVTKGCISKINREVRWTHVKI